MLCPICEHPVKNHGLAQCKDTGNEIVDISGILPTLKLPCVCPAGRIEAFFLALINKIGGG